MKIGTLITYFFAYTAMASFLMACSLFIFRVATFERDAWMLWIFFGCAGLSALFAVILRIVMRSNLPVAKQLTEEH